jgi:hypothetical protein
MQSGHSLKISSGRNILYSLCLYILIILLSIEVASALGRWNVLRPIIDPEAPPSRSWEISENNPSKSLASPPEKTTSLLPLKDD